MRDLILLGALLAVFPLILRAPAIGVLTWIWVTLMNPQREVYGFLGNFELNFYIARAHRFRLDSFPGKESRADQSGHGAAGAVRPMDFGHHLFRAQHSFSYELWDRTIKTLILALAIITIANNKARIQAIVWVTVLSLAYYRRQGRRLRASDRRPSSCLSARTIR